MCCRLAGSDKGAFCVARIPDSELEQLKKEVHLERRVTVCRCDDASSNVYIR